jgi:hypothetical protein
MITEVSDPDLVSQRVVLQTKTRHKIIKEIKETRTSSRMFGESARRASNARARALLLRESDLPKSF